MDKFKQIREQFPVTENFTYLNNAAVAPAPPFITKEAGKVLEGYGASGGELENQWHRRIGDIRANLARLTGAGAEELFFTSNTSQALLLAAQGFPWKEGDNVVCLRGEFPANVVPFNLLERRGVTLRMVEPGAANVFAVKDIEDAMDSRTRMLAVSFVEFHTGFRNRMPELGELCSRREVFFVLDGVQGVGALRTTLRDWGVDLMSCGGHKWMMAGEGTGFAYLRRDKLDLLEPVACSWLSLEQPLEFLTGDKEDALFAKPLRPEASRFEGGTLNIAGIHALGKSAETILELGMQDIEKYILSLGREAVEGIQAKGYRVLSPQGAGQRSGITVFRSEKIEMKELLLELRRKKISLGFPCGSLRISPHYYNNLEDIERLLDALPAV